jgi:hypothetical protein
MWAAIWLLPVGRRNAAPYSPINRCSIACAVIRRSNSTTINFGTKTHQEPYNIGFVLGVNRWFRLLANSIAGEVTPNTLAGSWFQIRVGDDDAIRKAEAALQLDLPIPRPALDLRSSFAGELPSPDSPHADASARTTRRTRILRVQNVAIKGNQACDP